MKDSFTLAYIAMLIGVILMLAIKLDQQTRAYEFDRAEWVQTRTELYDKLYPTGCCNPEGLGCEEPIYGDDC